MTPNLSGRRALTKSLLLALSTVLVPAAQAVAEDLRTLVAATLALPSDPAGVVISLAYNEGFALTLPKEAPFLQGFEIEIKSPAPALALPGSISWELWRRLDPLPEKSRYAYSGERLLSQVLPARAVFALQIPLRGDHSLKTSAFSQVIPTVLEARDFPFLFRLQPIAKGVPPDLERAGFQVRIRPLFTDEGALRLGLRWPEGQTERGDVSLFIDGKAAELRDLHVLKPGAHFLHVSSDIYREESRSFTVEQGKILDIEIDLADTTPILVVEAPDSALVTLDGKKLDHAQKPQTTVEVGEHIVVCRIGDYSLTRKFSAFRGKTYRVVLSVNLDVQESP